MKTFHICMKNKTNIILTRESMIFHAMSGKHTMLRQSKNKNSHVIHCLHHIGVTSKDRKMKTNWLCIANGLIAIYLWQQYLWSVWPFLHSATFSIKPNFLVSKATTLRIWNGWRKIKKYIRQRLMIKWRSLLPHKILN